MPSVMRKGRIGLFLFTGMVVAACQGGPRDPVYSVTPASEALQPVIVASVLEAGSMIRLNELGGEIPVAKPSTDVDDEGMGDVR